MKKENRLPFRTWVEANYQVVNWGEENVLCQGYDEKEGSYLYNEPIDELFEKYRYIRGER